MRILRLPCLLLILALFSAPLSATPTAILVDTSRSVSAWQFQQARERLIEMLPALLSEGEVALYGFNDSPEPLVGFTADEARLRTALENLGQGGNFTLLYDCLFRAVKDLEERGPGGVILLVTDGRDENSAVTLEDAAGRAEQASVVVVPVGMGSPVDDKALRRVAVLTGGDYAGGIRETAAEALGTSFLRGVEAARKTPPAPPAAAAPARPQAVAPSPAPPAAAPGKVELLKPFKLGFWLMALGVLILLFLLVVVIVLLLKRVPKPEERVCDKCGRELRVWEVECPECLSRELELTKPGAESLEAKSEELPELDPALLRKAPSADDLENTLVLDEVPILILQRGKSQPRVFQLPAEQVVSIGRDKVNTISVNDPTLSAQHFRIVPREGVYYLVDLQSTNGTLVNGERVNVAPLKVGSVVHAGQCDFTFKREQRRLN